MYQPIWNEGAVCWAYDEGWSALAACRRRSCLRVRSFCCRHAFSRRRIWHCHQQTTVSLCCSCCCVPAGGGGLGAVRPVCGRGAPVLRPLQHGPQRPEPRLPLPLLPARRWVHSVDGWRGWVGELQRAEPCLPLPLLPAWRSARGTLLLAWLRPSASTGGTPAAAAHPAPADTGNPTHLGTELSLTAGLRTGERRIPTERPQAMLSARDMPPCDLSDHLEKRLERALRIERQQVGAAGSMPHAVQHMHVTPQLPDAATLHCHFIAATLQLLVCCLPARSGRQWRASTQARSARQRGSQVRASPHLALHACCRALHLQACCRLLHLHTCCRVLALARLVSEAGAWTATSMNCGCQCSCMQSLKCALPLTHCHMYCSCCSARGEQRGQAQRRALAAVCSGQGGGVPRSLPVQTKGAEGS